MSVQRMMFGKNTYSFSKLGPQLHLVLTMCITEYFIELKYTVTFVKMCFRYILYKIKHKANHISFLYLMIFKLLISTTLGVLLWKSPQPLKLSILSEMFRTSYYQMPFTIPQHLYCNLHIKIIINFTKGPIKRVPLFIDSFNNVLRGT
jgi:hypothetical protein